MTKRIRVFNTPEELTESAKKNAEYWIDKGLPFAFGRFGDAFMIAPTDENGTQTGNGAQMFFENHEFCGKFFENFRMVVAHTPEKSGDRGWVTCIRGSCLCRKKRKLR